MGRHAARHGPQLPFVLLPHLRWPCSSLLCSVLSVFSVVVLLLQQQKGTTESTEDTEANHQEPSSTQHPADVGQQVAVREPERACAAGRSLPRVP